MSLDVLVTIRSLTVILLIVSHALKHLHHEPTLPVKVSKQKSVQLIQQSVQPEQPVVKKDRTSKEPTPINENLERVKAYLADHPNAAAREVGRALGLSATSAAKWVKRLKETA